MTTIAFYGVTTGWGKLSRIAAIARHLPDALVITAYGGDANVPLDYFGVPWHAVTCETGCRGVTPQLIANHIAELAPDVLVMDAWPYGQAGEVERVVRRRDPATNAFTYRINPTITADVAPYFQVVLATEAGCPVDAVDVQPCLPLAFDELPTRTEARAALDGDERPIAIMPRSGYQFPDIGHLAAKVCDELDINFIRYDDYPLMNVLPGVDVVIGYAGWIVNEAAVLGIPTITVATATGPSFDQPVRANCTTAQDVRDRLATVTVLDRVTRYEDRSHVGADAIANLLARP